MKNNLPFFGLLLLLLSGSAFAEVSFISPAGLRAEVMSGRVVDQKFNDVPIDQEGNTRKYLTFANLELTLKITDAGCSLETDTPISVKYTGGLLQPNATSVSNQLDLYVTIASAVSPACGGESRVERTESLKVPLVNGVGAGAKQAIQHVYTLNALSGRRVSPAMVTVTVNQAEGSAVLQ